MDEGEYPGGEGAEAARARLSEAQRRYLERGLVEPGGKLPLFDREGREIPVPEAIDEGELKVRLHGEKLNGNYVLVRTGGGDRERWLLIKERGEGADARRNPARTQPESVISGRTLKQVEAEEGGEG